MNFKRFKRLYRHVLTLPSLVLRYFPASTMQKIEAAIAQSELAHGGQICFAVETNLPFWQVLQHKSPKRRAVEVFSQLRVWDTEYNNGVLIYLLLADKDFEILADRGIHQYVGYQDWERICQEMQTLFKRGEFETGVLHGVAEVSKLLAQHYPATGKHGNELTNTPVVL